MRGRGVKLVSVQPMSRAPYIVVAPLMIKADGNVQLASEMDELWLDKYYHDEMEQHNEVVWDSASGGIRARLKLMLGALVIKEQAYSNPTGRK